MKTLCYIFGLVLFFVPVVFSADSGNTRIEIPVRDTNGNTQLIVMFPFIPNEAAKQRKPISKYCDIKIFKANKKGDRTNQDLSFYFISSKAIIKILKDALVLSQAARAKGIVGPYEKDVVADNPQSKANPFIYRFIIAKDGKHTIGSWDIDDVPLLIKTINNIDNFYKEAIDRVNTLEKQ